MEKMKRSMSRLVLCIIMLGSMILATTAQAQTLRDQILSAKTTTTNAWVAAMEKQSELLTALSGCASKIAQIQNMINLLPANSPDRTRLQQALNALAADLWAVEYDRLQARTNFLQAGESKESEGDLQYYYFSTSINAQSIADYGAAAIARYNEATSRYNSYNSSCQSFLTRINALRDSLNALACDQAFYNPLPGIDPGDAT